MAIRIEHVGDVAVVLPVGCAAWRDAMQSRAMTSLLVGE
jgi:hypothetical protein